jgi:hypothetical protein
MSLFERFFGRRNQEDASPLVATRVENPLSIAVLFAGAPTLNPTKVVGALQTYDNAMKRARFEADPEMLQKGIVFGLAGWGRHVVQLVGFDAPYPRQELEPCLHNGRFDDVRKQKLADAQGHVILYYAGQEESPYEQYVALCAVAGALCRVGAIGVVNPHAITILPGEVFGDPAMELDILRAMPILAFICSWGTLVGAHALTKPDLAARLDSREESREIAEIFSNILAYLCETNAHFAAGHTMQVGEYTFMKVRASTADEAFLEGQGPLLIAEFISSNEINQ